MGKAAKREVDNKHEKYRDYRDIKPAKIGDQPTLHSRKSRASLIAEDSTINAERNDKAGGGEKYRAMDGV